MKPTYIILIIILVVVVGWMAIRFIIGGNEDTWIKDERGVWIEHGHPNFVPDYILEQSNAIECALNLYEQAKNSGMNFSSQCLGTCEDYAVDIVHVPRTSEDNLAENQCEDYRAGKVSKFIELDSKEDIVRIV